jgi:predicted GTPase
MDDLLDLIAQVMAQMEIQVPTSMVNRLVEDAVLRNSPPIVGQAAFRIYYSTMVSNNPPRFVMFVNNPKLCAAHYLGYLNNYQRKALDFTGLPIEIFLRERPKKVASIRKKSPFKSLLKPYRSLAPDKKEIKFHRQSLCKTIIFNGFIFFM